LPEPFEVGVWNAQLGKVARSLPQILAVRPPPAACPRDDAGLRFEVEVSAVLRVRAVDDPHLPAGFRPLLQLDAAPTLFPPVPRPCGSFSQWWTRATRGLQQAGELL